VPLVKIVATGGILSQRGELSSPAFILARIVGVKRSGLTGNWKQERNMPERVIPTNFQDDETLVFKVASLLMRAMCSQASARLLARDILAAVRPLIERRRDAETEEALLHEYEYGHFREGWLTRVRARLAAQRGGVR